MKKILITVFASILFVAAILVPTAAFAQTSTPKAAQASEVTYCNGVYETGPALQESVAFCQGSVDVFTNSPVFNAAMSAAANQRIILGTPLRDFSSVDWSGNSINYVEFSNGYHAEYSSNNFITIFNQGNGRVYQIQE